MPFWRSARQNGNSPALGMQGVGRSSHATEPGGMLAASDCVVTPEEQPWSVAQVPLQRLFCFQY